MAQQGEAKREPAQPKHNKLYINGQWEAPKLGGTLPVINPAFDTVWTHVAAATKEDVDLAVAAAKKAFVSWRLTKGVERARYLDAIADEVDRRRERLAELEVQDNGKPLYEAFIDITDAVSCFRYYANAARKLDAEQDQDVPLDDPHCRCVVRREPVGPSCLISSFNYSFLLAVWKVAPCLAAGCTAVLKPSELTPVTALELADICDAIALPPGVLNVLTGLGLEAGSPLSTHPDIVKVSFTGSAATGATVATAAAATIKRVTLELGGKSPILCFEDADIDNAVEWVLVGFVFNAGQVCSATSRLLIHESIKDAFLKRLRETIVKLRVGPGLDEGTQVGPLVSAAQYEKVVGFIHQAIEEGARVAVGTLPPKERSPGTGYFVMPMVLDDVSSETTAWRTEIFGPVLCVRSFSTEEEALRVANDCSYGLAAAVMSKDAARCKRVADALEAGIVWVNCSQPTFVQAPWGGIKRSGIGRELGPWGLDNFLQWKQISSWVDESEPNWALYTRHSG